MSIDVVHEDDDWGYRLTEFEDHSVCIDHIDSHDGEWKNRGPAERISVLMAEKVAEALIMVAKNMEKEQR